MEKAIMISIKPKWVKKILSGEKTLEIRKTMPKCELPCKVYIYCSKGKDAYYLRGGVVAEFTLNKATKHFHNFVDFEEQECYNFNIEDVKKAGFNTDIKGLLTFDEFVENYGREKQLYAWHIDDLNIYDKPKELKEFGIKRPPQSWCYVKNS